MSNQFSPVGVSFRLSIFCASLILIFASCGGDDPAPSGSDPAEVSESADTTALRDKSLSQLLADNESLAITGMAYNVTSNTASVLVRFNAEAGRLKSAQLVLLLTDNPSKTLELGKGCTEVYIKSSWVKDNGIAIVYVSNLIPSSVYRYRVFYRYNAYDSAFGEEKTMRTGDALSLTADAVDLGLSVKWASWNLGAARSYQFGRFYSYGMPGSWVSEVASSSVSSNVSGTANDPATVELGEGWQSPTMKQCLELINNCDWAEGQDCGVSGFFVSGKGDFSGNRIFIPAAGFINESGVHTESGKGFMLWSGEISSSADKAYAIKCGPDGTCSVARARTGSLMPIRPVYVR